MDRAGDSAAQRHGHAADSARDRSATDSRTVQYFDPDTFIEAKLAQPPALGRGQPVPGNARDGRALALGELFEAERSRRHDDDVELLRLIINNPF
jgi:hypothetical protein